MRGKKNKPTFSECEEPKKLDLESHKRILIFLAGLMYTIADPMSLDEAIALHKLAGIPIYNGNGEPYYVDDCYILDTLREMSARGLANFRKKGHKKCVRTTSSTKRKVAKRKSA